MSGNNDIKKKIYDAVVSLMSFETFNDITISQICLEARISRQGFYNHFKSKDEILSYMLRQGLGDFLGDPGALTGYSMYAKAFLEKMPFSEGLLNVLLRSDRFNIMEDVLTEHYKGHYGASATASEAPAYDDYCLSFAVSTLITIIKKWTENGFKESREELSRLIEMLFYGLNKYHLLR